MSEVMESPAGNTAVAVVNEFTMDPNLLISVIKSQAGSLSKALLEGVMNSIDAGASRVDVTLTLEDFSIVDDGKGFTSPEEVRDWFGRFGTPHREDEEGYGRFRMGRGQMFSFASTLWSSGEFSMFVDIEKKGLTYEVSPLEQPFKGCRIEGHLYKQMTSWEFRDTLSEFNMMVAYAPKPVYVNGELVSKVPNKANGVTYEDEYAYYIRVPDADELRIYNKGVYVCTKSVYHTGMGGVVISKVPLKVNFARNDILTRDCQVWSRIKTRMEAVVFLKLTRATKLSNEERQFLARRVTSSAFASQREKLMEAKLLTDPSGRHQPLKHLKGIKQFIYSEGSTPLACAVAARPQTYVVTSSLLNRFGVYSLDGFMAELRNVPGLIDPTATTCELEELSLDGLNLGHLEYVDSLSKKAQAAMATLNWLNTEVVLRLNAQGGHYSHRELRAGRYKKGKVVAWTDGKTYISANLSSLKLLDNGLDGLSEWVMTLVHEYMHDVDDSESHSHSEVFYAKFHDHIFGSQAMNIASLSVKGLQVYMREMRKHGLSVPRELSRQLKPAALGDEPVLPGAEM